MSGVFLEHLRSMLPSLHRQESISIKYKVLFLFRVLVLSGASSVRWRLPEFFLPVRAPSLAALLCAPHGSPYLPEEQSCLAPCRGFGIQDESCSFLYQYALSAQKPHLHVPSYCISGKQIHCQSAPPSRTSRLSPGKQV